jgi:hypothetical protein
MTMSPLLDGLPNRIENFGTRSNRVLLTKNVMHSINPGVAVLSSVTDNQMLMMLVVSEIQAPKNYCA